MWNDRFWNSRTFHNTLSICTTFSAFICRCIYISYFLTWLVQIRFRVEQISFRQEQVLLLQTGHTSSDSGSVIITSICGSLDNLSSNCPLYFFFFIEFDFFKNKLFFVWILLLLLPHQKEKAAQNQVTLMFHFLFQTACALNIHFLPLDSCFLFGFLPMSLISATTADCICRYNSL